MDDPHAYDKDKDPVGQGQEIVCVQCLRRDESADLDTSGAARRADTVYKTVDPRCYPWGEVAQGWRLGWIVFVRKCIRYVGKI